MFLALFAIASNPEAMVSDLLRRHNDTIHSDLNFIRNIQAWESDSLLAILEVLYAQLKMGIGEDIICWGRTRVSVLQ